MPLIQCHLGKRLSPPERQALIGELVQATTGALGSDPKTVSVILHEHDASSLRELNFVQLVRTGFDGDERA